MFALRCLRRCAAPVKGNHKIYKGYDFPLVAWRRDVSNFCRAKVASVLLQDATSRCEKDDGGDALNASPSLSTASLRDLQKEWTTVAALTETVVEALHPYTATRARASKGNDEALEEGTSVERYHRSCEELVAGLLTLVEATGALVQSKTFQSSVDDDDEAARVAPPLQHKEDERHALDDNSDRSCTVAGTEPSRWMRQQQQPLLPTMREWCIKQSVYLAEDPSSPLQFLLGCKSTTPNLTSSYKAISSEENGLIDLDLSRHLLQAVTRTLSLNPTLHDCGKIRVLLLPALASSEFLSTAEIATLLLCLGRCGTGPSTSSLQSASMTFTMLGELQAIAAEIRRRMESTIGLATVPTLSLSLSEAKKQRSSSSRHSSMKAAQRDEEDTKDVTLLDVAEIATGFAVLKFAEPSFWNAVALFTTKFVEAAACASPVAEDVGENEHLVVDGTSSDAFSLRELQAVCFALHRVGRLDLYDAVMLHLVDLKILQHRIPPPRT